MPTYNVTAWCDKPYYCRMEIEADDAAEALVLAKEQVNDNDAEACDKYYLWDRFQISDAEDEPLATWLDDEARLRDAAPKLLASLQALMPYARNEAEGLEGHRGEDEVVDAEADNAWKAVEEAEALLAGLAVESAPLVRPVVPDKQTD